MTALGILALLLSAGIVSVGLLELALRWWFRTRSPIHIRAPWTAFEISTDPAVLPGLTPQTRFTCNGFGARGGDVPATGRTFTALAIGGSSVECFLLDDREVWTAVAAEHLSRPDALSRLGADQVRVWNIGKSGVTTDTLLYALPDELARMPSLDAVMVMNGASAILKWCELGLPARMPAMEPAWEDVAFHRNVGWSMRPGGTALAEVYRRLAARRPSPPRKLDRLGRSVANARKLRAETTNLVDSTPDTAGFIAHYEATLGRVVDLVRQRVGRVLLIHQPIYRKPNPTPAETASFWHCGIGPPDKPTGFLSHRLMLELNQKLAEATERVARAKGVDFLDPSDHVTPTQENYYDHYHYRPQGARRMGEVVAARLLGLVAPIERSGTEPVELAQWRAINRKTSDRTPGSGRPADDGKSGRSA